MTQSMIKGSFTGAIIRIRRGKRKQNTDLYNRKCSGVIKRQNHKKYYSYTGHKGKDKKKGHMGYY